MDFLGRTRSLSRAVGVRGEAEVGKSLRGRQDAHIFWKSILANRGALGMGKMPMLQSGIKSFVKGKNFFLIPFLAGVFYSCGPEQNAYMPLAKGNLWSYTMRSGLTSRVVEIKVDRQVAVSGGLGWELTGPMGNSRLAWKDETLLASTLPGASFDPPVPLLRPRSLKAPYFWQGNVHYAGKTIESSAKLEQNPDHYQLSGRRYPVLRSTLMLVLGDKQLELVTWFSPGIGVLRQEHRTNGELDLALEFLSGP